MEFTVKGKQVEVKFNFGFMFKVDKKLGTTDANGNKNKDGIGTLFGKIVDQDETGIIDLIEVITPFKITEEDAIEAISLYLEEIGGDEGEAYDKLFEDVKQEMLDSGFTRKKILKYIKNLEDVIPIIKAQAKEEDTETKVQIQAIQSRIGSLNKAVS